VKPPHEAKKTKLMADTAAVTFNPNLPFAKTILIDPLLSWAIWINKICRRYYPPLYGLDSSE
jgi:hypothetical protein